MNVTVALDDIIFPWLRKQSRRCRGDVAQWLDLTGASGFGNIPGRRHVVRHEERVDRENA